MKIVAFLQNQWFTNPERVTETINARPEAERDSFRQRFATRALFAGCLTGKRLMQVLGSEHCNRIFWENASLEMGEVSSAAFKPDIEHIQRVLDQQKPDLVIAFGVPARQALESLVPQDQLLTAPHPAARGTDNIARLKELRADLEARISAQPKFT